MACETQNANRTVIDREIGLQGSLDEDQHARLLAISESGIPDVLGDSGAPEAFVRSSLVAGDNSKRYARDRTNAVARPRLVRLVLSRQRRTP